MVPRFSGSEGVVEVRDHAMHNAVPIQVADLFCHCLLTRFGESLMRIGQTHMVSDDTVPSEHLLHASRVQALASLLIEVVHKAVHYGDKHQYNTVVSSALVILKRRPKQWQTRLHCFESRQTLQPKLHMVV